MAVVARKMIPKRPGFTRQRRDNRDPKRTFGVRLGGGVRDWIEDAEEQGIAYSALIVQSLELAMHMSKDLGAEWWEVDRRAKVEGVHIGEMFARLIRAALDAERKPRK